MAPKRGAEEMEAAYVQGAQKRWAFSKGMAVEEALGHISRDTQVGADLLVLESKAGEGEIILARDSKLAAGADYRVRIRTEALPKRRFAAGLAVDPVSNYYISPDIDDLVSDLVQGKYCALCGPRQSGKSTMVLAARNRLMLQSEATLVYLDGLEGARRSWSSHDFWGYVCDSLTLKCLDLFPRQQVPYTPLVFKSLFARNKLPTPVIVVLDEADSLLDISSDVVHEFFATIRAVKSDKHAYNLHGFLLVGVETVKDLLEARYDQRVEDTLRWYVPGSTPSRLSSFPHDHVLTSSRFTLEDVRELLQQAASDRPSVVIEVDSIVASIMQRTGGHKGLTGTCLAYLVQEELWTFKCWFERVESYGLATYIFGQATYNRILSFIRKQEQNAEAFELLLKYLEAPGFHCGPEELVQLRDFIAHGVFAATVVTVLDSDDEEREQETYYVQISTPLLRTAMLRRCIVYCDDVDAPPCATRLDREWLLLQVIETLDEDFMYRPECLRARGASPSEYVHQFLFLCRMKAILRRAYPCSLATVLPEVMEEIVPDQQSQLRCDSLVRDGVSKFAVELIANGAAVQIVEHMTRALLYHEQHSAQVFVINFCMDKAKEQEHIVVPVHDSLVFMSVNFCPSQHTATVTIVDSSSDRKEEVVPLKNWSGRISFPGVVMHPDNPNYDLQATSMKFPGTVHGAFATGVLAAAECRKCIGQIWKYGQTLNCFNLQWPRKTPVHY